MKAQLCVLMLFLASLGVCGFGGSPSAIPVARTDATLFPRDVLAQPGQPVMLEVKLVRNRIILQQAFGGEPIEFLVDGSSIGASMTGGDGWARKEFIPNKPKMYELTVRPAQGRRVKAPNAQAVIASLSRKRPIVVVSLDAALPRAEGTRIGPFELPAFLSSQRPPDPRPGASDALQSLAKRAALIYLKIGQPPQLSGVREWLETHAFPLGPLFMIDAESRPLSNRIASWKDEGWSNIVAGIVADEGSAEAFVDQKMRAVVVAHDNDEIEDLPEGAVVVSEWKNLKDLDALKFK